MEQMNLHPSMAFSHLHVNSPKPSKIHSWESDDLLEQRGCSVGGCREKGEITKKQSSF